MVALPSLKRAQYTRDDLIAMAAAAGHGVSPRLVTDWVELGLIDRPAKRGLGRGKGTIATWPESQAQLFLALLDQHSRGAKRVASLANVPVWLWVYWGDAYVPLRQARRALGTWSQKATEGSWVSKAAARRSARELIDQVGHAEAHHRDRDDLVELLAEIGQRIARGEAYSEPSLVDAFRRVVEPPDASPADDALHLAEMFARLLAARLTGIRQVNKVSDDIFRFARGELRARNAEYLRDQPALAADPRTSRIATPRDLNEQANNACLDLVTLLGFLLLAADKAPSPHTRRP